jgi:hypothetical protein
MTPIHSHARTYRPSTSPTTRGRCVWVWLWEDVALSCDDRVIPGEQFCAEHLIEHNAPQTFPARVVNPTPPPERPTA